MDIKVVGADKFRRELRASPWANGGAQMKAARRAAWRLTSPLQRAIKASVPVASGALQRSIKVKGPFKDGPTRIAIVVTGNRAMFPQNKSRGFLDRQVKGIDGKLSVEAQKIAREWAEGVRGVQSRSV